jgi:hypothetical protein
MRRRRENSLTEKDLPLRKGLGEEALRFQKPGKNYPSGFLPVGIIGSEAIVSNG